MIHTIVRHESNLPYQIITANGIGEFLVISNRDLNSNNFKCLYSDPSESFVALNGDKSFNLKSKILTYLGFSNGEYYYKTKIKIEGHKLRYYFSFEENNSLMICDERGVYNFTNQDNIRAFFVNWSFYQEKISIPNEVKNVIWYQIFPDRFASSQRSKEEKFEITDENCKSFYYHGNIKGIIDNLDYIKALGCGGIYLNPIFFAQSLHKYDTIDYNKIDPWFGTEDDFALLCLKCHDNGMKIMLDGVFNHCSELSPYFMDVIKNGNNSEYFDYFILQSNSSRKLMSNYEENLYHQYETFAFVPSMPKWNTSNNKVQNLLINSAVKWTKKYMIDGWRLDVPDEINDEFLIKFRKAMLEINPNIYIIGEIWSNPFHWLKGNMFDGVMNYTLYFIIRDFVRGVDDVYLFVKRLKKYTMTFPLVLQEGMFNFCGNHDVPRMLDYAQFSKKKTIMAHAISLMMPGNFNLYYGDERFLSGAADPFNRKVFPWYDIDREDDDILTIKQLIHYYNEMDRTELVLENTVIENNLLRLIFVSKSCDYELIINISEESALIETNSAFTNGNYFEGNLILNLYELAIIERKKQI